MRPAYNPFFVPPPPEHTGKPRVTFSTTEILHIVGAVAVLTLCFAIVVGCRNTTRCDVTHNLVPDALDLVAAFLAVASGFVLHELAHKVVAQRFGHWAEFRAQFKNLLISYVLALFTGLLLAAPGAVLIQGQVTRRENGLISLVGPGTNFVIAVASWPLSWSLNPDEAVPHIFGVVAFANALLCIFNLIPFGPLDGKKVWRWNRSAWVGAAALAVVLFAAILYWRNQVPFSDLK